MQADTLLADTYACRPNRLLPLERGAVIVGISPGDMVLEVGCGSGEAALFLAARFGCRVLAIDADRRRVSDALKSAAADRGCLAVSFQVATAARLPVRACSVDTIVAESTLCHVAEKAAVLREFRRVLRPAGHVILNDFALRECSDHAGGARHLFPGLSSVDSTERAFAAGGFELVDKHDFSTSLKPLLFQLARTSLQGGLTLKEALGNPVRKRETTSERSTGAICSGSPKALAQLQYWQWVFRKRSSARAEKQESV